MKTKIQKVYTRNRHNPKSKLRGYIAAVRNEDNSVTFGFSLCRRGDKFDKGAGISGAIDRAVNRDHTMASSIKQQFAHFHEQATKYFTKHTPDTQVTPMEDYLFI
jgi:hypothetical protein